MWCVSLCLCSVSRVDLFSVGSVSFALLRAIVGSFHFLDICVRRFFSVFICVYLCVSVSVGVRRRRCLSAACSAARHLRRRLLPLPSLPPLHLLSLSLARSNLSQPPPRVCTYIRTPFPVHSSRVHVVRLRRALCPFHKARVLNADLVVPRASARRRCAVYRLARRVHRFASFAAPAAAPGGPPGRLVPRVASCASCASCSSCSLRSSCSSAIVS